MCKYVGKILLSRAAKIISLKDCIEWTASSRDGDWDVNEYLLRISIGGRLEKQRKSFLKESNRGIIYDAERVNFFIKNPIKRISAIFMECKYELEIFDGYHRYMAALACSDDFINVDYDGDENTLSYLKGERSRR